MAVVVALIFLFWDYVQGDAEPFRANLLLGVVYPPVTAVVMSIGWMLWLGFGLALAGDWPRFGRQLDKMRQAALDAIFSWIGFLVGFATGLLCAVGVGLGQDRIGAGG